MLYLHASPPLFQPACAALTVVNMSEEKSLESHSLEHADTLNARDGDYDDKDVFGHEEEHDVRDSNRAYQHISIGSSNLGWILYSLNLSIIANSPPFQRSNTRRYHGSSFPPL